MIKTIRFIFLLPFLCAQFLFSQISVSGSFSEPCKPGGSATLKILVKKYDLKDFLLLQIETPADFFVQAKDVNGGNFVNSGKKYAIEWAEEAFPKNQEFEISLNVLAPDNLPDGDISFTTKVAFMLGENEKNESLAPILWNKITSSTNSNASNDTPVQNSNTEASTQSTGSEPVNQNTITETSTQSTGTEPENQNSNTETSTQSTGTEPVNQNTITESTISSSETALNPDTLINDSLTKVLENKKRQNFDIDSLKQFGVGDKIEIVVQQMTQLKIDAKEVRKVGEGEYRAAKSATEKETAERILKIAVDMETEALVLERLLANVTYTYSDDAIAKSSKSSVSAKNPKTKTKSDNTNYTPTETNTSTNSTEIANANSPERVNDSKPGKKRKIVTEEVDANAQSIISENQPYYRVQIGAFRNKPSQIPYKNKLKNWQLLCDANGIYRIQVGVYKTKQEALDYQAELSTMGVPQSFVVKILK